MVQCNPSGIYQNLFLTVPQRCGTTKEILIRWIRAWRQDMTFMEVVLEPYAKPKAGYTHHFHVGLCFPQRVRIGKLIKACNKSEPFKGMNFSVPIVKKGATCQHIFTKYFTNPSKYKALDENPTLVINHDPMQHWRSIQKFFASNNLGQPAGFTCEERR